MTNDDGGLEPAASSSENPEEGFSLEPYEVEVKCPNCEEYTTRHPDAPALVRADHLSQLVDDLPTRRGYKCPDCGTLVQYEHDVCSNEDCDRETISIADKTELIPKDRVRSALEVSPRC